MDCNKDEALRAKAIAERKVVDRDYAGAKKFALKAQTLYPGLEGIPQLLAAINVHISAEKKVNGEVDWYAVLDTKPWVGDETVKKQYRKLVLALHPDKNKAVGADGAYKLVSEAWTFLSDKAKRLAYNDRLNPRSHLKYPAQGGVTDVPDKAKTVHTQNVDTFWTVCNHCKTQFEYLRIYLNHTLLCPSCHEAFLAVEKPPPPNAFKSSNSSSHQQHQNSRYHAANSNLQYMGGSTGLNSAKNTNLQRGPFFGTSGVNSKNSSSSNATQAASVVQQAHEKYKRECEEAAALKKRRIYENHINVYGGHMGNHALMKDGVGSGNISESRKGSFETEKSYGFYNKLNSRRELSLFEIRNMLVRKAQADIRKKLEDWRSVSNAKANKDKTKMKEKESRKQKNMENGDLHDLSEHFGTNEKYLSKESLPVSSGTDTDNEDPAVSIIVPDSDFHNFDLDRTESSFGDDHVWAAYDDDDGMPRFYARIHKVISLKPFKMRISWLNSRSNSELGPLNWIDSGFTKTCGDFRTGKHENSTSLNSFSHKVKWIKGNRGVIRIFPSKGDVWALYRNWSVDWNENTPDEVIHKYDMVEVLDDYDEGQGVSVIPLVKVDGFKTVFRKNMEPKQVQRIPKEEMFRFSHQVPSCLLTGQEAQNAPAGCWELDPAATPLELVQVTTEANDAAVVDSGGKIEGVDEIGDNTPKAGEGEMV